MLSKREKGYKESEMTENELIDALYSEMRRGCFRSILSTIQMLMQLQKSKGVTVGLNYIVGLFLQRRCANDPLPLYYASRHYNVSDFFLCLLFISRIPVTPDILDISMPFEDWFKCSGTYRPRWTLPYLNDELNDCIKGGRNGAVIGLFKNEPQSAGGVLARLRYMLDSVFRNSFRAVHTQEQITEPYTLIKAILDRILKKIVGGQNSKRRVESSQKALDSSKKDCRANLDMIERERANLDKIESECASLDMIESERANLDMIERESSSEQDDESTLVGLDLLTTSTNSTLIGLDLLTASTNNTSVRQRIEGGLKSEDDEKSLLGLDLLPATTDAEGGEWRNLSEQKSERNVKSDTQNISSLDFSLCPFRIGNYGNRITRALERRLSHRRKSSNRAAQFDLRSHRRSLQKSIVSYANKACEECLL